VSHEHGHDIRQQHADLRGLCAELQALATREPAWSELDDALARVEQLLADHFRMEELGGYMSWVVQGSPAEEPKVRRLRGEHDDLWGRLRHLRRLATEVRDRAGFRDELQSWATLLGRHESEETSLLDENPAPQGA
jgi:hypothetical protein